MHGSDKILNLLLQKHSKDLCVPECKTGSSWLMPTFQKLDLWVMKKSWTKPWTTGYEIKVSRSDFLKDSKWPGYLAYCSDFYLVAPPGIIQPQELPADVGLLITSKNVTRLYTKRKAVHRDVEIPESIFRYVLMWRTKVIRDQEIYGSSGLSAKGYWQAWLAEKDERKELGHNVSRKIGQLVKERIDKVKSENSRLRDENKNLTRVKDTLKALGLDTGYIPLYSMEDRIKARVREIETGIPEGLLNYLNKTIETLTAVKDKLTNL